MCLHELYEFDLRSEGGVVLLAYATSWYAWRALPEWFREIECCARSVMVAIGTLITFWCVSLSVLKVLPLTEANALFEHGLYGAGISMLFMWLDIASYLRRPAPIPRVEVHRQGDRPATHDE